MASPKRSKRKRSTPILTGVFCQRQTWRSPVQWKISYILRLTIWLLQQTCAVCGQRAPRRIATRYPVQLHPVLGTREWEQLRAPGAGGGDGAIEANWRAGTGWMQRSRGGDGDCSYTAAVAVACRGGLRAGRCVTGRAPPCDVILGNSCHSCCCCCVARRTWRSDDMTSRTSELISGNLSSPFPAVYSRRLATSRMRVHMLNLTVSTVTHCIYFSKLTLERITEKPNESLCIIWGLITGKYNSSR